MAQYEDWLPMGEVIQRTGMSERTIYRHVTAGKLRQAQRPIPGRKPLPVYNPEDVAALAELGVPGNLEVMPPLTRLAESIRQAVAISPIPPTVPPQIEGPKTEPVNGNTATAEWRNVATWPVPLWLTEEHAVRYSGLGIGYLQKAVTWRKIGPRGSLVCRRVDLDAL